jgi:hypothetical protein
VSRENGCSSEKPDATNLEQMDVSDLRKLIVDAQALEVKKGRSGKRETSFKFRERSRQAWFFSERGMVSFADTRAK